MEAALEGLVGASASTRANVSQNKEKRSKRVKWTDAEVAALREGVERYGEGRWAVILREYAARFDAVRISVDLKDKWRNLFKAHRTPVSLPPEPPAHVELPSTHDHAVKEDPPIVPAKPEQLLHVPESPAYVYHPTVHAASPNIVQATEGLPFAQETAAQEHVVVAPNTELPDASAGPEGVQVEPRAAEHDDDVIPDDALQDPAQPQVDPGVVAQDDVMQDVHSRPVEAESVPIHPMHHAEYEQQQLQHSDMASAQMDQPEQGSEMDPAQMEQPAVDSTHSTERVGVADHQLHQSDYGQQQLQQAQMPPEEMEQSETHSVQMQQAEVQQSEMHSVPMEQAEMHSVQMQPEMQQTELQQEEMHSVQMQHSDMQPAEMHSVQMQQSGMHSVPMEQAEIHSVHMQQSDLHSVEMQQSELQPSEMHSVHIQQAAMHSVEMQQPELHSVEIQHSEIHSVQMQQSEMEQRMSSTRMETDEAQSDLPLDLSSQDMEQEQLPEQQLEALGNHQELTPEDGAGQIEEPELGEEQDEAMNLEGQVEMEQEGVLQEEGGIAQHGDQVPEEGVQHLEHQDLNEHRGESIRMEEQVEMEQEAFQEEGEIARHDTLQPQQGGGHPEHQELDGQEVKSMMVEEQVTVAQGGELQEAVESAEHGGIEPQQTEERLEQQEQDGQDTESIPMEEEVEMEQDRELQDKMVEASALEPARDGEHLEQQAGIAADDLGELVEHHFAEHGNLQPEEMGSQQGLDEQGGEAIEIGQEQMEQAEGLGAREEGDIEQRDGESLDDVQHDMMEHGVELGDEPQLDEQNQSLERHDVGERDGREIDGGVSQDVEGDTDGVQQNEESLEEVHHSYSRNGDASEADGPQQVDEQVQQNGHYVGEQDGHQHEEEDGHQREEEDGQCVENGGHAADVQLFDEEEGQLTDAHAGDNLDEEGRHDATDGHGDDQVEEQSFDQVGDRQDEGDRDRRGTDEENGQVVEGQEELGGAGSVKDGKLLTQNGEMGNMHQVLQVSQLIGLEGTQKDRDSHVNGMVEKCNEVEQLGDNGEIVGEGEKDLENGAMGDELTRCSKRGREKLEVRKGEGCHLRNGVSDDRKRSKVGRD